MEDKGPSAAYMTVLWLINRISLSGVLIIPTIKQSTGERK